jgi:hypothetical protein
MARYALIDGYLDTMRSEMRWRRDLDDVVYEMEDHLYSAVEYLVTRGTKPTDAQRTTLDRFGEPKVLAAVYASTSNGGIAVPTRTTRRAGTFAFIAAGAWLAAAAAFALETTFTDQWQTYYGAFSALILVGGVFTLLTMVGIGKRLGGLGSVGMVGLAIAGLGVAASIIAWAIPFWMGLQGIGYLVFASAVRSRDTAPRPSTLAVASGFIIGVAVFAVADFAKIGWTDSYGDYPLAWAIGALAGLLILGGGLIGWGAWLRSEEPADIDIDATPIPA